MADNVPITAGSGTTVATDDVSGVHYQRVKLVNGTLDATDAIAGDVNGLETQGGTAEDAALAGNPNRVGVRAHATVPTAMSADNDIVTPWSNLNGALVVVPSSRIVQLSATPAITTSAYAVNDQVGVVNTFTGAALAIGRSGTVLSAVMHAKWANTIVPELDMFMFEVSPTLVGADNAAFDITDANFVTARCCGVIEFKAAEYQIAANSVICQGSVFGGPPSIPFVTASTANLFSVLATRTVFTAASTTDIVITLRIAQD